MGFETMGMGAKPEASKQESKKIDRFPEEDEGLIFLDPAQIEQLTDESLQERLERVDKALIELANDKPLHEKRLVQKFWLSTELKRRKGDAVTIERPDGKELKMAKDGSFFWEEGKKNDSDMNLEENDTSSEDGYAERGEGTETMGMDVEPDEPEQESKSDPELFDLCRRADDAGRYDRSLDDIKKVAEDIAQKLYELGATKSESKLSEAYISASKVKKNYQDVDQARSAMKRIASLIYESDGFQDASEKWKQNQG